LEKKSKLQKQIQKENGMNTQITKNKTHFEVKEKPDNHAKKNQPSHSDEDWFILYKFNLIIIY
jgi:hypothetical protein